jgi:hypothetical protein
MFKFEWTSIFQDAQANGGHLSMTLLSMMQHKNDKGEDLSERKNVWSVQVNINAKDKTFKIGDKIEKI